MLKTPNEILWISNFPNEKQLLNYVREKKKKLNCKVRQTSTMFASLNLFKSVICPYYSTVTNVNSCERPYCQFKHGSSLNQSSSNQNSKLTTSVPTTSVNAHITSKSYSKNYFQ